MSDNYYALMSESIYHEVETLNYYIRKISSFCKDHRCATCPLSNNGSCSLLKSSPCEWKGIENHENND